MAIRITRIDDIDGSDGAESIVFGLDRKAYEIDLCARNRIRFLRAIEPFIGNARVVDESRRETTITRLVRRVSDDDVESSQGSPSENSDIDQGSGGPDLIEMARRIES
jgi:hypothetical protein